MSVLNGFAKLILDPRSDVGGKKMYAVYGIVVTEPHEALTAGDLRELVTGYVQLTTKNRYVAPTGPGGVGSMSIEDLVEGGGLDPANWQKYE